MLAGHPHGTVVVSRMMNSGHACTFLKHSWGATVDVMVGQWSEVAVELENVLLVMEVLGKGMISRGLREWAFGRTLLGRWVLVRRS